jgi:hypothetical protein
MMVQCDDCRLSGPALSEVVRVNPLVVRCWSESKATALSSMNKGHCLHLAQVVLNFERAYWMEKQLRACVLNIFSLVASLLAAEGENTSSQLAGSHG